LQSLAGVLNTVISGSAITQVRDDIYLVDVVMRATDEQRVSLDTLRSIQVPLPNGRTVPLSQFATFSYDQEQPLVWRRDRIPTLTVQADVRPGVLPETVIEALAPSVAELSKTLQRPYRVVVGGVVEDSAKAQASVIAVVPAMLLIMFTVLMVQLRSFSRLFIVLSVGPLGLIGVVAALLLSGKPLGFVAILGILALLGMITKNAVILIGQIGSRTKFGQNVWQRPLDAGQHPLPADHADSDFNGSRHDPDRTDGFLGTDGLRDHGRPPGWDNSDVGVLADVVRDLVRGKRIPFRSKAGDRQLTQARSLDRPMPSLDCEVLWLPRKK
jgi:multidrug efflux pump subunit AcrB